MIELDSNIARYYFETAQLDPSTFEVVRFQGKEGISRLFRYELELVSEVPDIDFSQLINQPATFTMMRDDEEVPLSGLISNFQQAGRTADYVAYRAVLVPRLWRLSLNFQSRIFQNQTVEEIMQMVLEEVGFTSEDFRFELSASYAPREYCVQYQETDLNFVSRLLEYEGICYFFEQSEDKEVLVMTDDRGTFPQIGSGRSELRYQEDAGMVGEWFETAQEFTCHERVVTGKVMMKDYNYRTPSTNLQVESQINSEMPGLRYEYGQHFKDTEQGNRLVKVRNEEIECQRRIMNGRSNCAGLRSGHLFTLEHHYRDGLNGDYLLTSVEHEGSQAGAMDVATTDGQTEASYGNTFMCIPSNVQYRPERRTPKPEVPGLMTAKIESAGGDYAYIDDHGEYRAKMHFDTSDRSDGTASKPIRMKQASTGPDYGIHFPNHADTEMIFACINGDIDRPLALGTAPNPSQKSPSVADNKMQNVIRSWGKNELTFDDAQGEENILMKATKDRTVQVANDDSMSVGHDQSVTVENDRKKTVKNNETNHIKKKRETHIAEENDELTVHAGDRVVDVNEGKHELNVKTGDRIVNVNIGSDKLTIKSKDRDVQINSGDDKLKVKSGKKTEEVKGPYEVTVESGHFKVKCGSSELILGANGQIEIKGTQISLEAKTYLLLKSKNIESKADISNNTKGKMVLSEGKAMNVIKGGMVQLNPPG